MRILREWVHRLVAIVRPRRTDDDLHEELRLHAELAAEAARRRGLTADEAGRAARLRTGGDAQAMDALRDQRGLPWIADAARDLGYGVRALRRNPGFTATVLVSVGLGLGANAAIFSFMDAILLRPLPVRDPASLVVIKWRSKLFGSRAQAAGQPTDFVLHSVDGSTFADASGVTGPIFPYPAFERLRQSGDSVLSSVFAYDPAGRMNVLVGGQAELATGFWVSGDFFGGLGVTPAAGRPILPADDRAGAPPVVVLSLSYSERRFGDAAAAVGQPVVINNVAFTVIGVTPREFFGVDPGANVDVYLPLRGMLHFNPDAAGRFDAQNDYWLEMMGRLRPGVSLAQAQAALAALFEQWVATTATTDGERANLPVLRLEAGAGGLDSLRRRYSTPLSVLMAMTGLILAIACANTANLLLARAAARRRELAVRLGLGAERFRIVRQLLTESVLLASLSGAVGILTALAGIRVLTALLASGQEGFVVRAELNWLVLLVTLGLAVLCGVVFGLAPAMQSTRPALIPALNGARITERRTGMRAGLPRLNLAQALVVAQMAISLLLVIAAVLFVRTLSNLQSIEIGFNRDNVLLLDVNAPQAGYPEPQAATFYADVRQRLADLPGVRAASLSHSSFIGAGRQLPVLVDGAPASGHRIMIAGPAFFTTMEIPVLLGREIDERDGRDSVPVAVVSELFAKTYFGDESPIGQHIRVGGRGTPRDLEIIGVAANAAYGGIRGNPPVVYIPYTQRPPEQMTYAVRTDGDPLRYVGAVREAVRRAGAQVPIANIRTQAAAIDRTINQEIVFARLCTAFALLALVIACVGLYGTTSYAVARRASDIGIRMALGAQRRQVVWMVLRNVCALTGLGLAISLPVALGASHFVESFLFNVTPTDPASLMLAIAILSSAALSAGYLPARRASRVDPVAVLRAE